MLTKLNFFLVPDHQLLGRRGRPPARPKKPAATVAPRAAAAAAARRAAAEKTDSCAPRRRLRGPRRRSGAARGKFREKDNLTCLPDPKRGGS